MSASNQSLQIAIIDRSVEGYHSLVSAAEAHGLEVILLSGTGDGFVELAELLNGRSGIEGLHLFSHGSPGKIHLGQAQMHSANLDQYRAVLEAIGQSLTADGDLLIYGCEVAGSDVGVEFVKRLSEYVGADVAASDNTTGSSALGGDWVLELQQGSIESAIAPDSVALQDFYNLLSFNGTFTFGSATTNGVAQSADSSIDGKYTKNGYTLVVDGQNVSTQVYAGYGGYAFFGGFADGSGTQEKQVTLFFENDNPFTITSLDIENFLSANTTFVFTSNLGGSVSTGSLARDTPTNVAFTGEGWEGITKLYISGFGGANIGGDIDNLVLSVGGVAPSIPPSLIATPANPAFTENGGAVDLFSAVTAETKDDGQTFTGMTLTVANVSNGATESLSIAGASVTLVNGNSGSLGGNGNFSVTVVDSTATVTLTGMSRDNTEMGALIDGITYLNTSDNPGNTSRVVTITQITDSGANNNSAAPNISSTVSVTAVNDAPTATNLTQLKTYTEDPGSPVALDDIVVTDVDGNDTITATLTISTVGAGTLTTGTFGSATSTFNAGTGVWTVTGSVTDVNAALAAVAFSPSANWDQDITIATRIRDAANTGPADGIITLDVTAVNDAPALNIIPTGVSTFIENGSAVTVFTPLDVVDVTDVDNTTLAQATVSITGNFHAGADVLAFINDNAVTFGNITASYNAAAGILTLTSAGATATLAQFENALTAITFSNSSDDPVTGARTVSFTLSDGSAGSVASTRTVNLTAVNDAPTNDPDKGYVNTGAALTNSGLVTVTSQMLHEGDPDNSGAEVTYEVTATTVYGTLFLDLNDNNVVDGGEARWLGGVFTQADIDAGRIKYLHGGAGSGDSFGFSVTDGEGSLSGETFSFSVTARPVITTGVGGTYLEDAAAMAVAPLLTLTDEDSANMTGATVSITDLVTGDTLGFIDQNGISGSFNVGTGALTLSGTSSVANYQAALRSVTYSSSSQNPATGAGNSDRVISFRVTDTDGLQSIAGTNVTLTIANVNDAPVLDSSLSPTLAGINEDLAAPANGITVNSTVVSSLLAGVSDVDSGALQGMAITAVNTEQGTLWYSVTSGEGASWTAVSNAAEDNALLLDSSALLYWQPAANQHGSVSDALTFRAWDRTDSGIAGSYADATTNGGTTAFSAASDTVSVAVSAVNDSPTFANASTALAGVNEDTTTAAASVADLLANLGYSDADNDIGGIAITGAEGNGDWQYSTDGSHWFDVAAVSNNASLLLAADAFVRYAPVGDNAENNVQLLVRAWDRTAGTATEGDTRNTADTANHGGAHPYSNGLATVTVAVTAVNDAPVLTPLGSTLASIDEDNLTSIGYRVSDMLDNSVTDVDTGAVQGIAIYSTYLGTAGYDGKWQYSLDSGTSWSDVGIVANSAALLLGADDFVRFVPDGKNAVTASFSFRAWDQTLGAAGNKADASTWGGTTAFSSATDGRGIHVSAVNDAPVLNTSGNPVLTALLPDAAAPEGGVTLGSAQGATLVSTLTAGVSDVDGDVPGIAITGKAAQGTLWFSTNAGSSWTASNAVSDAGALLLRATDLLYFQPAQGITGAIDVLSFRAWDTSTGAEGSYTDTQVNGGTTAFSTATESVKVLVGSVNSAPSLSVTPKSVAFVENDNAIALFSNASVSVGPVGDSAQRLTGITLSVTGLSDGSAESLLIDGTEVALINGLSATTAGSGLTVNISVNGSSAVAAVTGGMLTATQMQTLINTLAYRNSSETPTVQSRVVTLTSIKDSGGTANGGVDTSALNIASTITVIPVNDAPVGTVTIVGNPLVGSTLTISQNLSDADGLGLFSYVWAADDEIIPGATASTLTVGAGLAGKTISVSISYTDGGGTVETVQSGVTAVVQVPPAGSNVDGAIVSAPTPGVAPDGTAVSVTEIGIVSADREEQVGEAELANVPLITGANNRTLLEVGLPAGTGMRIESPSGNDDTNGYEGLLAAIRARTQNAPEDQQEMTGVGSSFLNDLPDQGSNLIVRTLVPTVPAGSTQAPGQAIRISSPPAQVGDRPVATVIDTRNLPSGTVIELENIQFVAIIGEITMTGGAGAQVVTGDSSRQIVVLGADDDIIRGGGGDDFIGSRGGDDRLYGEDGNDHLVGGAGNDHLEGGSGNDVLQGGASDAGRWSFSLIDGALVSDFTAEQPLGADAATMSITGPWWTQANNTGRETDDRLQFTYESVERLQLVATLYAAAVGEKAELMEFNHFTTSGLSDEQLAQAAVDHFFGSRPVPQALEVQVAMLINAVWGEGAATSELVAIGSEFISNGGTWAEGMLILARGVEAEHLLKNANGDLVLVKDLHTSETGSVQANSGNDTLLGGDGNDRLVGGGGNNFLDGGDGIDVAVYTGAPSDFTFQIRVVDGQAQMVLTTTRSGAVDVLQNIELLKIGGYYYEPAGSMGEVDLNTDYALENHLVQLIAEQVIAMDLAGFY